MPTAPAPLPMVVISKILVPENIRQEGWEKKIGRLKDSIEADGLEQPIKVRILTKPGPGGELYELVWGFRRLMVCKELGWTTIPAIFASSKETNKDIFISRLVENFERSDLTPLEEATAFRKAIDELGISAKELADRLGQTSGFVSQRLGMLKLPEPVQKAVQSGKISATHARELGRVTDEKTQLRLLKSAEDKELSATDLKEKVDALDVKDRKSTNRGRKAAPSDAKDAKKEPGKKEVLAAMDSLVEKKKAAAEAKDETKETFYKGMIRGIGWARGMVKNLF
jgi:ParB family chromosome partitioning protein